MTCIVVQQLVISVIRSGDLLVATPIIFEIINKNPNIMKNVCIVKVVTEETRHYNLSVICDGKIIYQEERYLDIYSNEDENWSDCPILTKGVEIAMPLANNKDHIAMDMASSDEKVIKQASTTLHPDWNIVSTLLF